MTVKDTSSAARQSPRPPGRAAGRILQGAAGLALIGLACLAPGLALRESRAALVAVQDAEAAAPFLPAGEPLSFRGRIGLLEGCLRWLVPGRIALLPAEASGRIVDACGGLASHPAAAAPSEAHLVAARLAILRKDRNAALAALERSRDAAPADGWLALQRIRAAAQVATSDAVPAALGRGIASDLRTILAGDRQLAELARDMVSRPGLRAAVLAGADQLAPGEAGRLLAAIRRTDRTS
ncbi:hypothetical protein LAZ40_09245 [Cereibacter sphaeroides]|uniref:hypothetical protein n=1 Tax=Cereibacter sphaeroides TaxID=1063 RepID=UPI001F389267|nr:hypothetical protein [Cereibacter sphaeroides]MCE6959236.1 hypothetical protein [Cereibacter sphaeroides]MCE6972039.1 hypothetical protein [Cereibacter sphaeroides]